MEITKSGVDAKRRSISNGTQAGSIARALETANTDRNNRNAQILAVYNGKTPFSPGDLAAAGELWRRNFSTNFLATIVDRVVPAPIKIIDAARYLTNARLPDKDKDGKERPEAAKKSELFQEKVTKAVRQWNGWKDFGYGLFQEDVLMGGAFAVWLDEDDWRPWLGKQDQVYIPEGTGQHSSQCQLFTVNRPYLIHDAVDFIKDGEEVAGVAGWDVDAMVESINEAAPKNPAKDDNTSSDARSFEDVVREGTQGQSYETGAKVVDTTHVLVTEPDTGKVTQFILDRRGQKKTLFLKEDRYDKMEDCITFFTLQPGNGKFYGSKGLGRILGNMALSQERTRNEIVDQFQLGGLIILKTGVAQAPQLQLKIKTPLMVVSTDGEFIKQPIEVDVDKFLQLDAYMSRLAEMAAGAYIPDKITTAGDPTAKTATEATIDASRENEAKIAFLARAWGQIANMISTIQRRLCKKGTSDEVAKQLQKDLKDGGFTDEEIQEIANVPAAEVVQDLSTVQGQQIQQVAMKYRGDPSIDQQKLMRYDITAMSTPQLADDIIIPQNDHTIEAEEIRMQLLENAAMSAGESVNISPRDKHDIHAKVCLSEVQRSAPGIVKAVQADIKNAPMLDTVNAALMHTQAHIDAWKQQGAKPEQLKPYQDAIDMADKMLQEFAKKLAEQAQQAPTMPADASQPQGGANMPPADPNAPQQIHPEEHMLKITSSIKYEDAPPSIQAQIEAAAGFVPASAEERKQSGATEAVQKHPDLPAKLQEVHPSEVVSPQPVDPSQVVSPQQIDPSSVIK